MTTRTSGNNDRIAQLAERVRGGDADRLESEIRAMQGLAEAHEELTPIVRIVATSGEGVDELMAAIARCEKQLRETGMWRKRSGNAATQQMDHLGVAVRSLAEARKFYELLGLRVSHEETVEREQVRVAMLELNGSHIELLEPMSADSVIGKFLARRGEGLHHVAVRVPDVEAAFARLRGQVRLVRDEISVGAGGHRYFFVHPEATGGVLVEVVGDASVNDAAEKSE